MQNITSHAAPCAFEGENLDQIAFPVGGMGAGMFTFGGTGSFSQFSLRHHPNLTPPGMTFSAVAVAGGEARVLEGPVPPGKLYGGAAWTPAWLSKIPWRLSSGGGRGRMGYGFPRFDKARFSARFPFGTVKLEDAGMPLEVEVTAWNPFIPGDADASGLPVGAVDYRFRNRTDRPLEAVYSFHSSHVLSHGYKEDNASLSGVPGGFVLRQAAEEGRLEAESALAAWIAEPDAKADLAWYTPHSDLCISGITGPGPRGYYSPWYASRFAGIEEVVDYWSRENARLHEASTAFADAFYDSTLPPEVLDAVASNLTILKTPTVLREADGGIWGWEGIYEEVGSCHGTCTHVWNYAQALPHLFPELERGLRETEFFFSQDERGHQNFRSALPRGPVSHEQHAAADGQLGGIVKVYREWRISGDLEWLRRFWPRVRASLDYCIGQWDPDRRGVLAEPHHNTYDIEFWGPNGMSSSFYLAALRAAEAMGRALGDDVSEYGRLAAAVKEFLESELFNGEYFIQKIQWQGLRSPHPVMAPTLSVSNPSRNYSPEGRALLEREGPKHQYGNGCLSDGILGEWLAWSAGLEPGVDPAKTTSHLAAVYRHNFRRDLAGHVNTQRPGYAFNHEGGLLLCTWPHGDRMTLPFIYSDEVWTGIEYQVAAHLISFGRVEEGLEIVRACRARYDGKIRNPFSEIESGYWYARALASYSLLQALTGARYDAVEKTLHVAPRVEGDFRSFLAADGGYGTVGVRDGKPFFEIRSGNLEIRNIAFTPFHA